MIQLVKYYTIYIRVINIYKETLKQQFSYLTIDLIILGY